MGRRRDILVTLKNAIEGLDVTVDSQPRKIRTSDTVFDPAEIHDLPMFSITPSMENIPVGVMGLTLDRTMVVNVFGFVDGGTLGEPDERGFSALAEAAENCVQAIVTKLTSDYFLEMVNCTFSITQIGPVIVEHAERENPLAYISMPLTVQWVE